MKDEVMAALWKAKEDIARENDHDLERLGAMLRERERGYAGRVVDRTPCRKPECRAAHEGRQVS